MARYVINMTVLFIVLLLCQVVICNHIMLFNCATPLIFIYFIIRMSLGVNINYVMTFAFLMGLCVDIFSDTLGLNTLACTILSVIKRPIIFSYCQHDETLNEIIPSISTLGIWIYSKYLFTMTLVYSVLVFAIEYFSFNNLAEIALCSISSALLTFMVLLCVDSFLMSKREKRL